MPHRLNEFRAKVQFVTSAEMPHLIYKACVAKGVPSNTVYIQHAVCRALAEDLGIPLEDLLENLPPPRGRNKTPFDRRDGKVGIGPSGGVETVGKVGLQ